MRRKIVDELRRVARGQVLFDPATLAQYSRDRSMYEIKPLAVVFPEDAGDAQRLIEFASREGAPVTARGGGSGLAGSALGRGIVMALPDNEYWGRISGFTSSGAGATVSAGAGVYHNKLQDYLRERGFFLPADVTSAGISRIGGNIATKASGPHALKFGSIDHFLESVEFVTAQGELVDTANETTIPERFANKLADLEKRIRADRAALDVLESKKNLKTSSGYNLRSFLRESSMGARIARLLAGSVGTLGFITRAVLRAVPHESERAAALLYFDEPADAGRAVALMREFDPAAVELISRETINVIRERSVLPGEFAADAHLLLVEVAGPGSMDRLGRLGEHLNRHGIRLSHTPVIAAGGEAEKLWDVRRRLLWYIEHPKPGLRALSVVNDVAVLPERLAEFIADTQRVFKKHGLIAPLYGHAGNGNLHLRPLFDVTLPLPELRERIRRLADEVYDVVFRHNGTMTAEHGMGRLRAPYLRREWGNAVYKYMREVKNIFDPRDILNPGAMFGDAQITDDMREDLLGP